MEREYVTIRTLSLKRIKTGGKSATIHLPPTVLEQFGFKPRSQVLVRIRPKQIIITLVTEELQELSSSD